MVGRLFWCTSKSTALTRLGDRSRCFEKDISVIERGAKALAACVNIHTLSVVAGDSDSSDSFDAFCALFDPIPIFSGLRNLELRFTFDDNVLEFVKHHYRQLRSLTILHAHEDPDEALAAGTMLCSQFSLPLSTVNIDCSPFLTPIFIPNSSITEVSLLWPNSDWIDDVASQTVMALTCSNTPVTTVTYESRAWNLEFIRLAATHLQQLESISIVNTNDVISDAVEDNSADTYMVRAAQHNGPFSSIPSLSLLKHQKYY